MNWPKLLGLAMVLLALFHLGGASAVTLSSGDILVVNSDADRTVGQVLKIDPVTGDQTVVSEGDNLIFPIGIAMASNGDLYVTDELSAKLVRIDPADGAQTELASGGYWPGIVIDGNDDVLVTDPLAGTISRLDPTGLTVIADLLGRQPSYIALEGDGALVVTSDNTQELLRVNLQMPQDPPEQISVPPVFQQSFGVAVDSNGYVFVADDLGSILRVDPQDGSRTLVTDPAELPTLQGITVDADDQLLVSTLSTTSSVRRVDPSSGGSEVVSSGLPLRRPRDLLVVVPEPGPVLRELAVLATLVALVSIFRRRQAGVASS